MDDLDAQVRLAAFRFLEEHITPDYIVQVRRDVLDQEDGPMLIHGLQGFHGKTLRLPRREAWLPDRRLLEERYARFRKLAS